MAKVKFNEKESRDEKVNFHYREFELDDKTYCLSYCSGPSFLDTGRTDPLFMQIQIIPRDEKENIEFYVLKRYPIKQENTVIQHILVNPKTKEISIVHDNKSLEEFLSSINDKDVMMNLFASFPNYERPNRDIPLELKKLKTTPASDYDLMRMYFKNL